MQAAAGEATRLCLQRQPEKPAGTLRPAPLEGEGEDRGGVLACARCLTPVTTTGARIAVGGAHEHTFVNPHGLRFHIGCFAKAAGCIAVGAASTYWSWFAGHSWQIEHCGACGDHLGWLFRSADSAFHGLILDRLVELDDGR